MGAHASSVGAAVLRCCDAAPQESNASWVNSDNPCRKFWIDIGSDDVLALQVASQRCELFDDGVLVRAHGLGGEGFVAGGVLTGNSGIALNGKGGIYPKGE